MKRLSIFLPLLLTLALLQGCSNGSSSSASNVTTIRLVNGTSASLDMVTGGTVLASGVAYGTASNYASMTTGTQTILLEKAGAGVPSAQINFTFSSTAPSTLLAYTSGQDLHIAQFVDSEPAPVSSGDGKIRIADLAADAGNVDVYMAMSTGTETLPTASRLAHALSGTTAYSEIHNGTYHIWVTGADAPADLRLEIPSIVIGDQQILTLALTGTSGGVLVDGLQIIQQGAVAAQQNTNARIRLAANTTTAITSATAGGLSLLGGASSFNSEVGSYILVPAGSTGIALSSGTGIASCPASISTTHGEDLTLLVTATTCTALVDDNTLPPVGYAKLRLVNAINGSSGGISLTDNLQPVGSNVALGAASTPTDNSNQGIVPSNTPSNLVVTPTTPAFSSNITLQSQGVYSLFMLGDSTAATGILSPDH